MEKESDYIGYKDMQLANKFWLEAMRDRMNNDYLKLKDKNPSKSESRDAQVNNYLYKKNTGVPYDMEKYMAYQRQKEERQKAKNESEDRS